MTSDPIFFIVPGRLDTATGGYIYDRQVVDGLAARGWSLTIRELDDSFPRPTSAARQDAARALADVPDGATVIVDGLALGALPEDAAREGDRIRLIGFVHLPLADETGLPDEVSRDLLASERQALQAVRHVVVPSATTRERLHDHYGVDRDRITVIEPGTDPMPAARGSGGEIVHLLSVATLTPRKGHEVLFRALAALPVRHWTLTCAGSEDRDRATAARLADLPRALGIDAQVRFIGSVDRERLAREYDAADVFVLPTFREGFCMAICEALAHGLPIVSTPACGVQDVIGREAGVLVPPGDVAALTAALAAVIGDPATRARLAQGARAVRGRLPDWPATIDRWEAVLHDVQR
jgi:glycosyltransferase involved in cell wall biosynthesis